jgi:hypothetical protein
MKNNLLRLHGVNPRGLSGCGNPRLGARRSRGPPRPLRCDFSFPVLRNPSSVEVLRRVDCFPNFTFSARLPAPSPPKP